MSARVRGQEATLTFIVDGVSLGGDFAKVKDFTLTQRADLTEEPYLGEQTDDLDVQHHGWDFSFNVDTIDGRSLEYVRLFVLREESRQAPSDVNVQILTGYRQVGVLATRLNLISCVMKMNDMSFAGRKEMISVSFEGKAKKLLINDTVAINFSLAL